MTRKTDGGDIARKGIQRSTSMELNPQRRLFHLILLTFFFLLMGSGILLASPMAHAASPVSPKATVSYPAKAFQDGKAKFYEYKSGKGITIRYFILQSSDGVIRAAFDACDVCWPEGKGYAQKGDFMVCRNCGRKFISIRINEVKGGCNPAPLARQVAGDKVVIKVKDILEGAQYFDFSRRASR